MGNQLCNQFILEEYQKLQYIQNLNKITGNSCLKFNCRLIWANTIYWGQTIRYMLSKWRYSK